MFASTALIAALVKHQFGSGKPKNDEVTREVIEKVASELKAALQEDAASTTGSQTTIVDEDNSVQLQSRIKNVIERLFHASGDDTLLTNANQAINYIAYALSDLLFVYPGSTAGYLGQELSVWSQVIRNSQDQLVKIVEMQTRAGALQAVQGALAENPSKSATVLTSSEALLSMIPNIHVLALTRQPVVFHVAAQTVDQDLVAQPHVDGILAARNSGALLLASKTVQEAHDMAIAAHLLAKATSLPVIHYFDGASAAKQIEKVKLVSFSALAQWQTRTSVQSTTYAEAYHTAKQILQQLGYQPFEYIGAANAETVFITLGAGIASVSQAVARSAQYQKTSVGLLSVRLYRPWSETDVIASLPTTVRRVVVLEEGDGLFAFNGPLFLDIAAAIRFGSLARQTRPRLITAQASTFNHLHAGHIPVIVQEAEHETFIDLLAPAFTAPISDETLTAQTSEAGLNAIFWDVEQDHSADAAFHITHLVHQQQPSKNITSQVSRDAYRLGGAVVNTRVSETGMQNKAQYIGVHNVALTKEYDILASAQKKATVLLHGPWKHGDEIEAHLTNEFKLALTQLDIKLYTLDAARIAEELGLHRKSTHLVWEAAFLHLVQPESTSADRLAALYNELEVVNEQEKRELQTVLKEVVEAVKTALTHVELLPPWTILEINDEVLPSTPIDRCAAADTDDQDDDSSTVVDGADGEERSEVGKWHQAAFHVMFGEAYEKETAIRPDLHEATYLVKLTENKRLTPASYDRNVFHLEFDTSGSGLKYSIGDALGVHGHNDQQEVREFLQWYGLKENDVVLTRNGESGRKEARTVLQLFTQTLDVFGRPNKKFYEGLAQYATDPKEREQLLFLVSSEGKEEYKKRVDETITFEDLLREFTSAKPPLEALVHMITPIKPRHYSIASSQKMHPNSVHLLVVAVDWQTSTGKKRYGQCTRYLADLPINSDVTVSIKPSVMKLPPLDTQPVIMAGLGTGMAPFRAFIQERAVAKAAGKEIGPVVLYFGSRNRRNEYLYGEELEAYHAAGILSHMGLAFSRDQKEKVYIQHKMMEDAEMLHDYLINKNGHFYLCGPTWPVPDVKDAVVYGLKNFGGIDEKTSNDLIEEWKEKEKYILEVY
ncbi:uncharacterized protein BYT42DRAFT_578533 [Radiomyces spectabilis]|uniref:uncharacterized protein n=1 Tax=Radiomyces spectabilis TaxID=64574 RepID=UPI00221EA678|nr:uncharacterized protein BYT42DRAFT_578533 [Radiomyces spectabilis]KAI8372916.1 hypothetical protein BYT42DRAFT_578533 [Radiomyces spectabilis]